MTESETAERIGWPARAAGQLDFYWQHLRPRLEGLTDDELFWEPVPGMWSVRPRAESTAAMSGGAGELVVDFEAPEPVPAPATTIAWRLTHVIVDIFGSRCHHHFDGPAITYEHYELPTTAEGFLAALDDGHARWAEGVAAMDPERWAEPVGPAEGPFADEPYAELVLHINREVVHHCAEVGVLRDLYAWWPR